VTGIWQRFRVTNTSQYDLFNEDLALDPASGAVHACANAGPGAGGMTSFDGLRWTGATSRTVSAIPSRFPATTARRSACGRRPAWSRLTT
jgi:hypothetical protein